MPELPEVETVMMGLKPAFEGHRFTRVETRRKDLRIPFPPGFAKRLTGARVVRMWRRAKYIMADLDNGETLVIHLGMSGSMSVYATGGRAKLGTYYYERSPEGAGTAAHDHVVFETDAPAKVVFNDHRRFGLMTLIDTARVDEHKLFKDVGVEPLSKDLDGAFLAAALKGKKTPIKSALLDQRIIAGLGNIYVCEALWRARVSPRRLARRVKPAETAVLVDAIKEVLAEAVKAGGSSLRDHKRTDGELGYFQHHFCVYDRANKLCKRKDGGTIRRIVQSGRSSFYCPVCQK
ncbi:MAG: bifunctional DNA-formamidopyrimidine glycosylase/DNA-(apurinic or apyrimidinic site) lyase [Alphaproteobacteria bacterium]|nr:bifunctional DNA-formamidopyrimidine glycosylase/DNA-(apurinic or apyrimidinic site) lyase [Alphaproteobacteria bacterium]